MMHGHGLLLGVGNLLLQDEGVGIHVVQAIAGAAGTPGGSLPPGTRVVDGGTLGLDLLPLLDDADSVVFVDAANLRQPPGTVEVLREDEVAAASGGQLSVHQVGLADLLAAARLVGSLPEHVSLVAVQPSDIAPGLDLTPDVEAAVPEAMKAACAEAWVQFRAEEAVAASR